MVNNNLVRLAERQQRERKEKSTRRHRGMKNTVDEPQRGWNLVFPPLLLFQQSLPLSNPSSLSFPSDENLE